MNAIQRNKTSQKKTDEFFEFCRELGESFKYDEISFRHPYFEGQISELTKDYLFRIQMPKTH